MRSIIAALILLLAASAAPAQEQEVLRTVDWESGTLFITVRAPLPAAGPNQAAAVSQVAAEIERRAAEIVGEQLRALQYDSAGTIDDLLVDDPRVIHSLNAAAEKAVVTDAHATKDLRAVELTFQLDLYTDLLPGLTRHDRPVAVRGGIGWTATRDYTGVVIYAADELAVHGTNLVANLRPALYPGIYYRLEDGEGVQKLMEANHIDPEFLHLWGPVYYTDDPVQAQLSDRVGDHPLMIIAYGAFGQSPTDVVISNEDAHQILATANNRELITQGRIAIVLNSGQM